MFPQAQQPQQQQSSQARQDPPDHIKELVRGVKQMLRDQGFEKEEQLRIEHAADSDYDFLRPSTKYFWYFNETKRELLQELIQQSQQQINLTQQLLMQKQQQSQGQPIQQQNTQQGNIPQMQPILPPAMLQKNQLPPPPLGFQQPQAPFFQQPLPGMHLLPPPPFNPQIFNQFQQQQQNNPNNQLPMSLQPQLMNPQGLNLNPTSPQFQPPMIGQKPLGFPQQMGQPIHPGLLHDQQQHFNPSSSSGLPSSISFNQPTRSIVFNPSQKQLQQQHEIHKQKILTTDVTLLRKRTRWGDSVEIGSNMVPMQPYVTQSTTTKISSSGSSSNPYQKRVVLSTKHLELLSGGLMVEVVKLNNRRLAEEAGHFKKYSPVDIKLIPDYLLVDCRDSSSIKSKLLSLKEYSEEQRENELKSLAKKRKEREREQELRKMEEQGIDTYDLRNPEKKGGAKRNIEKEIEDLYAYPITKNEMNEEMGIKADGSLARPSAAGLGGNQENAAQVFSAFRMARSKNYHASAEERQISKDKTSDVCYKCTRPGHIAKECKFGMS